MAIRVGILTSGGDCPGLNATLRGVAKALYHRMGDKVEIVGIMNGYDGLINGNYREMSPDEFSGILTVGGTILGTKRTPFKKMRVVEDDKVDKVAAMKKNYRAAKLDCLLCLGGNGTHKTANLLSQEGLNIIGLPKTIDNDIYGTDVTFGFHTAVDIATEVIDRIHTTAGSHSRVMCIEIMGNKAGWLTLYSGIAGGADIILLPELPYDIKKVAAAVENRAKAGKNFSILAVAEGAFSVEEAKMKRKEWTAKRAEAGYTTATARIAKQVEELTGGSVVIDVQASGVLGSENDVLDAILGGSTSIDMSRISAFALTSYGCNKSKLLSIPFTFENRAHFWNFANSDLAPEFLNEPQELGLPVRGLFYGEEGFRHFFTVNPVSGIDDFKGLKLRVSNDPVMNGLVEGLGANPTVVSFGELYSALQTGVVDGAEQPIANYKSNAFPEVANNLILDGHTLGAVQAVITDNAWGKLTANQQAAVMAAAADTQKFNADLSETAENKVLEELRSSGCNVVDVDDKTPWQEACQKVISENTSDQAELYQQLLDMKA